MKRIAIIGAGISGLTVAQLLKDSFNVTVFEKESTPGGLIRCKNVDGNLFHICGGHVFNTKNSRVDSWFWSHFDKEKEFVKALRNSVVIMDDGKHIPYPIENHVYMFEKDVQVSIINDLLHLSEEEGGPTSFQDFLKMKFGETLYQLYFRPYNEKVWKRSLDAVPLEWLEGKLPMPTVQEMLYNNMNRIEERQFVHSSFFYEIKHGSQFIADRLSEGLNIVYSHDIACIETGEHSGWVIDGQRYDIIVFCGNLKQIPSLLKDCIPATISYEIGKLDYHGTTSVFCEIEENPYSWCYLPSNYYRSHRIICTGNFAKSNNARGLTGTIEFTDAVSLSEIKEELMRMPLKPRFLDYHYSEYTYPIQGHRTRGMIEDLKNHLAPKGFYFTGRFADWEYYNMDVAINAAMQTSDRIIKENAAC